MEKASWLDGIEERAVEAYKRRELKALPGFFEEGVAPGDKGCCALGALYNDQVNDAFDTHKGVPALLGVPQREIWSFALGFDRRMSESAEGRSEPVNGLEAYRAGIRTAEAVINAGLRV